MAIFAGGFSLDAASALCADDRTDEIDVLDGLSSLVEKSLVIAETLGAVARYRILESTRDYALEKLRDSGEYEHAARKHAHYYARLAERSDEHFYTGSQAEWFAQLREEYDNVRSALLWTLTSERDPVLGGAMAGALERFWFEGGHLGEGLGWIDTAEKITDEAVNPKIVARLELTRAVLQEGNAKIAAAEHARRLYEAVGEGRGLGFALRQCALALRQQRRWADAEKASRHAAEVLEETGDAGGFAVALNTLASIRAYRGDLNDARAICERALGIAQRHCAEYAIMQARLYLADLDFQCGRFESAVEYASEALDNAERAQIPRLVANLRANRTIYNVALGLQAQAAADAYAALPILQEAQDHLQIAIVIQHLALLAVLSGEGECAARWTGYVDSYYAEKGLEREPTEAWGRQRIEETVRSTMPQERFAALWREGSGLSETQVLEQALTWNCAA